MANRIVLNTVSYHGQGAIQEIPGEITGRGYGKAFVCSDPDLIQFGVTRKVTDVLDAAKVPYEIYSNIKPNPTIENVQTGVAAFQASGADCIVAIGGGSSMDTAKAIGIIVGKPRIFRCPQPGGRRPHEEALRYSPSPCRPRPAPPPRSRLTMSSPMWRKSVSLSASTPHDIPDGGRHRPGYDEQHAQGADRRHRHGRPDPRHRGIYHQGRLGDDRHVPSAGPSSSSPSTCAALWPIRTEGREGMALGPVCGGHGLLQRRPGHRAQHGPFRWVRYTTRPMAWPTPSCCPRSWPITLLPPVKNTAISPRPWAWRAPRR